MKNGSRLARAAANGIVGRAGLADSSLTVAPGSRWLVSDINKPCLANQLIVE